MERQEQAWTRELHKVLCMQGGDDDHSYAKNSHAPASAIALSKPLLLHALSSLALPPLHTLAIADLGCATGYNTQSTVELVVHTLKQRYIKEGISVPEFEVFFCDLPSNDFNSLFTSLSQNSSKYFISGVPGSFYDRLFSRGRLHFAVSLSALHWLSKVPEAVLDENSSAWNKGRAWIDGGKKEVVEAYTEQSKRDLEAFLRCRREEIVQGGMLFLVMAGRGGAQLAENQLGDPDSRAKHPFNSTMDQAWEDLLTEGLIDEATRDTFNIPAYMRSTEEVKNAFDNIGGFEIRRLEYRRVAEHTKEKKEELTKDPKSYARAKANLVRATLRPIVEAHIGPELSEELFVRFERRVSQDVLMMRKTCFYGLIVVFAIRS